MEILSYVLACVARQGFKEEGEVEIRGLAFEGEGGVETRVQSGVRGRIYAFSFPLLPLGTLVMKAILTEKPSSDLNLFCFLLYH